MASVRRASSPGSRQGLDARRLEKTPVDLTGVLPGVLPWGVYRFEVVEYFLFSCVLYSIFCFWEGLLGKFLLKKF